jgi:predicted HTH transcriptional regulator
MTEDQLQQQALGWLASFGHTPLREGVALECKAAQGASGRGDVPKDFWPTYSAMANAHGGVVLLGVREKAGVFSVAGLGGPAKVRADLFNNLNNPGKVSTNLLSDADVQELVMDGKTVLAVRVPQAARKEKPVFLNGQPLGNTYRRLNDGDRQCDDDTVKRMLAEQVQDSRDTRICNRFGLADLDLESLHAYRNQFASHKPGHPWAGEDDTEFLRLLGAWRDDRNTGESGLTLAGVLMFGQWPAIMECAPLYFVDYQEQPDVPDAAVRWLDRVVPDGTWSGNVFDFYRKVIRKLTADLKVPFALRGDTRVDDTPIHQALREALVNTLVHADYSDRASVRVIRRPSGFEFRNPGALRVPAARALKGGESDCRNRTLQQMFLMINLGERAGSGLLRILSSWQGEGHTLQLSDSFEPYDQSVLTMGWTPEKTLGKTPGKTPGKTQREILALLQNDANLAIPELAQALNKSESAIERAIKALRENGWLERVGPAKGGYWKVVK